MGGGGGGGGLPEPPPVQKIGKKPGLNRVKVCQVRTNTLQTSFHNVLSCVKSFPGKLDRNTARIKRKKKQTNKQTNTNLLFLAKTILVETLAICSHGYSFKQQMFLNSSS